MCQKIKYVYIYTWTHCLIIYFNQIYLSLCLVTQTCPTLCDSMECSPPGSSVHGIFQAIVLEWIDISFSRGSSHPGTEPGYLSLQTEALPSEPIDFNYCPSLDLSADNLSDKRHIPFHTVHGVLKARILKWLAILFSSGPHSVRPLHRDPPVLGCPTGMAWFH